MSNTLKLVLTDHWFEEIKSGRKTHEYRKVTEFWEARISKIGRLFLSYNDVFVEFQKAYRKNPEKMTFKIKKITVVDGLDTDLHCEGEVFDIELGEREKIEKRTPEVGDVWEYKGKLYNVSLVSDSCVEVWCKSTDALIKKHIWCKNSFISVFTYLGKSKVSIEELFDVAED